MSINRIKGKMNFDDADSGDSVEVKIIVVQTPMGIMKVALPLDANIDGNPLETAMDEFQKNVEAGQPDPLQSTLNNLKELAEDGDPHPLFMGLALLGQMSAGGMLPPMEQILEGTTVTPADVAKAEELVNRAENIGPKSDLKGPDIDDKIDRISLN